ncbi:MAG TPA: hypothetical protein VER14_07820 [Phototrophicaceae bacterium]|nr:hypothetical protein [Phototrophicaceae bacterium]
MPILISKDSTFINLLRSNLKEHYNSHRRNIDDKIHVSDILWGSCLRKAYYARVIEDYEFTDDDIDNFVRGESSEHVLVDLADIGVGQHELFFEDDLIARPDLLSVSPSDSNEQQQQQQQPKNLIVEFKDTKSFERLTPENPKFKGYLRQLLYYLIISGFDAGVLCIRYASNRKLQWIKRDEKGDYFFSPLVNNETGENKLPELETWTVILEKDSDIRELLKDEIRMRVSILRSALNSKNPMELPKVAEEWKCIRCPFLKNCNPLTIEKKDSKKDILDDGKIIVLSS